MAKKCEECEHYFDGLDILRQGLLSAKVVLRKKCSFYRDPEKVVNCCHFKPTAPVMDNLDD